MNFGAGFWREYRKLSGERIDALRGQKIPHNSHSIDRTPVPNGMASHKSTDLRLKSYRSPRAVYRIGRRFGRQLVCYTGEVRCDHKKSNLPPPLGRRMRRHREDSGMVHPGAADFRRAGMQSSTSDRGCESGGRWRKVVPGSRLGSRFEGCSHLGAAPLRRWSKLALFVYAKAQWESRDSRRSTQPL